MWRMQQTQAVISIIFWSLALTGIFYDRANYYLHIYLGLDRDEDKQVLTKMAVLFVLVVVGVMTFGFLYDTIFRMWEQSTTVMQERSPYAIYKFNAYQVNLARYFQLATLKGLNTDGRLDKEVEFMERWVDKVLKNDEVLRYHVEHVEKWVLSDKIKWEHIDEGQIMKLKKKRVS